MEGCLIFLKEYNFSEERAHLIAKTHTQSSCDGVYSHGVNRFPLFIDYVERGLIDISACPEKVSSFGALEQWDGRLAPGISNAHQCMERTMELTKRHTMGCVALCNTNHWMRSGTYGWQAAEAGKIALCFTNTKPNVHDVPSMQEGDRTYYPGERTLATRNDNLENSIPVSASVWKNIEQLTD